MKPNGDISMVSLEGYEFRTTAPEWVSLHEDIICHVGVIDYADKDTYYKVLGQLENGQERGWVYKKTGETDGQRMQYGPDLPPEVRRMLSVYMDGVRLRN